MNIAEAHEVYVLSPGEVAVAKETPRQPFGPIITSHLTDFIGWTLIVFAVIILTWVVSRTRLFGKFISMELDHLRSWAPHITQITVGVAMLASAYYDDAFGPELSF